MVAIFTATWRPARPTSSARSSLLGTKYGDSTSSSDFAPNISSLTFGAISNSGDSDSPLSTSASIFPGWSAAITASPQNQSPARSAVGPSGSSAIATCA